MKKYIYGLLIIGSTTTVFAQNNDALNVKNLSVPSTPGFSLLDVAPSSIDKPSNPKALGLSLLNISTSSAGFPKNFAFELCPYWLIKHKNETPYKYFGIRNREDTNGLNVSSGILRKMSVSIVSVYNDSTSSLPSNTNFISAGIRTNLLTVRTSRQANGIKRVMKEQAKQLGALSDALYKTGISSTDLANAIDNATTSTTDANGIKYAKIQKEMNDQLAQHPIFQIDVAGAYANGYQNNNYENGRFFRGAAWVNACVSIPLSSSANVQKTYVNAIVMYKYLQQNILSDTVNNIYKATNANDLGIRIELELNNLIASFEYVNRTYAVETKLNGARRVGMIQYKINDKLSVYGTYGENFGSGENLFTLFGLNFGIGQTSLKTDSTN